VATVAQDGTITVVGEGSAVITASAAGTTATLLINGTPAETGQPGEDLPGEDGAPSTQTPAEGETHLVPPQSEADAEYAAVQNWRVYQMSETAVELPDIQEEDPLLPAVGWGALGLLLASALVRTAYYFREIRRN
jgi:hypothetical protein